MNAIVHRIKKISQKVMYFKLLVLFLSNNKARAARIALASSLLLISTMYLAQAFYIPIKAMAAQVLMGIAFERPIQDARPWPWADTKVIAKLTIGDEQHYLLEHASLRNLAFGPARISTSAKVNEDGNIVIAGHRDTHFEVLQHAKLGDIILLDTRTNTRRFEVMDLAVIDEMNTSIIDNKQVNTLTLVTCYPFFTLNSNTPHRFVIRAVEI